MTTVNETTSKTAKLSSFRSIIGMMINPAGTVKAAVQSSKWYFSLGISGLAFCLFFLQTGLDLYKTGQKGMDFVLLSAGAGLVYGLIVIPAIGVLAWLILKAFKTDKGLTWALSSFCLSYSGALVYGVLGIVFSLLLDWKTAMAFGITGVLWAVGPLIAVTREMTDNNTKVSVLIATFYSSLILVSWAFLSNL